MSKIKLTHERDISPVPVEGKQQGFYIGDTAAAISMAAKLAKQNHELKEVEPDSGEQGRLPVYGTSLNLTTDELIQKIRITKVEIDCLTDSLPSLENELFYRNNPECRPKL